MSCMIASVWPSFSLAKPRNLEDLERQRVQVGMSPGSLMTLS